MKRGRARTIYPPNNLAEKFNPMISQKGFLQQMHLFGDGFSQLPVAPDASGCRNHSVSNDFQSVSHRIANQRANSKKHSEQDISTDNCGASDAGGRSRQKILL